MNIIFDLDNTLIDAQYVLGARAAFVLGRQGPAHVCGKELCNAHVYKRPGVESFLEWCFENFDNVGMWTLSEQRWVDEVLDNVLDKFPKERWSFIWTGEKATRVRGPSDAGLKLQGETTAEAVTVKDLKKVFRTRRLKEKGFTRQNTIIVEDTPSNCARNYGNGIFVSSFDVVRANVVDKELPKLQLYLQHYILRQKNVRDVDKRDWRSLAAQIEEREKSHCKNKIEAKKKCFWMYENWFEAVNPASSHTLIGNTHKISNTQKFVPANYHSLGEICSAGK